MIAAALSLLGLWAVESVVFVVTIRLDYRAQDRAGRSLNSEARP